MTRVSDLSITQYYSSTNLFLESNFAFKITKRDIQTYIFTQQRKPSEFNVIVLSFNRWFIKLFSIIIQVILEVLSF